MDNGCHRQPPQRVLRSAWPMSSTRREVLHRARAGVNPDASLSLFAVGDSGAGAQHGQSGPGAFSGSAERPLGGIDGGRFLSTAFRSRCCPADENWIRTQSGEILSSGPCTARFGGAASVDCGGQDRCRACLNGPIDLTDSAQPVISLRPAAGHHTLPVFVPSASSCSPPSLVICRAIHRLSADLRNRRQLGIINRQSSLEQGLKKRIAGVRVEHHGDARGDVIIKLDELLSCGHWQENHLRSFVGSDLDDSNGVVDGLD
jgi:hypothetical protein